MKNFIFLFARPVNFFGAVLLAFLVSSCTREPQRLLFSNHPTEYKKTAEPVKVAGTTHASANSITVSAASEAAAIAAENIAAPAEINAKTLATELTKSSRTVSAPETKTITRKEKITALKTAFKEVKKAKKEIKQLKKADTKKVQAAGPVTNDVAIKIIVIGLILVLLGLVVPFLYGLGGLVVVIGLVLLLLNYL
ncbi:hypothetical protein AHMF7605_17980 [Adhaeribacter arboris]|uniref:Uncharacterized protein n=1 Tax=Adhaeribacter arboris TaxID=2072846 RepID=A0A2T2YID0_9BACT|nr:hypothetical protein [Adhaeribacter arboris]PSR55258.1 hypothetical protein AHMF7605_17980 [Adhaeribacter arboris]